METFINTNLSIRICRVAGTGMAHPTSDKRTQHLHLPRLAVTDYVGLCGEATGNNHALLLGDAAAASGYERQVVNIREKFKAFSTYIVSYLR